VRQPESFSAVHLSGRGAMPLPVLEIQVEAWMARDMAVHVPPDGVEVTGAFLSLSPNALQGHSRRAAAGIR